MTPVKPCRIVLVGMMGSGKSTVGRALAGLTGWPYYDNDELLEHNYGLSARELLARDGTQALRAAEAAALATGLAKSEPCIVGAPAGTITDSESCRLMADSAAVVWLTAEPETLAGRASGAAHRPWLTGDAVAWMSTTLSERAPLYQSLADHTVDTEARSADEVAAEILVWLDGRSECRGWQTRGLDWSTND